MTQYRVLAHQEAISKAEAYLARLRDGASPGRRVKEQLEDVDLETLTTEAWLQVLLRTKSPQIFAESEIEGNGSDWKEEELTILGDIGIATPVTIYDNGLHVRPDVHEVPFEGHLLFIPGALLRSGGTSPPADWSEVVSGDQLDHDAYCALYERRLLPLFWFADQVASEQGKQALITLPGLGCGQFAGRFIGQLGEALQHALMALLEKHADAFSHIKCVYYDPYNECQNERHEYGKLSFLVRPLTQGNEEKPQLCLPEMYEEEGDDFADCILLSVVAWDHVSWPGNDFYAGARATDDGVKAAATSAMLAMTGAEGAYNPRTCCYEPPAPYRDWESLVEAQGLQLSLHGNLLIFPQQEAEEAEEAEVAKASEVVVPEVEHPEAEEVVSSPADEPALSPKEATGPVEPGMAQDIPEVVATPPTHESQSQAGLFVVLGLVLLLAALIYLLLRS